MRRGRAWPARRGSARVSGRRVGGNGAGRVVKTHPKGGSVARVLRTARGGQLKDAAALASLPRRRYCCADARRLCLALRRCRSSRHHGVALGAQQRQLGGAQPGLQHHEALRLEARAQRRRRRLRTRPAWHHAYFCAKAGSRQCLLPAEAVTSGEDARASVVTRLDVWCVCRCLPIDQSLKASPRALGRACALDCSTDWSRRSRVCEA